MAIPDFQSFFYPFLKLSSDKKEHSLKEVREYMTDYFPLTNEEKSEKVPSGTQSKFDNRIYWTKSYFIKAKLIEQLGGYILEAPFEIPSGSRICLFNEPSGVTLAMLEKKKP